jgi:hypothetical protein
MTIIETSIPTAAERNELRIVEFSKWRSCLSPSLPSLGRLVSSQQQTLLLGIYYAVTFLFHIPELNPGIGSRNWIPELTLDITHYKRLLS